MKRRKSKSIVPRNSLEYKELIKVRDQMLEAVKMLEKAKQEAEEHEAAVEKMPIIQMTL